MTTDFEMTTNALPVLPTAAPARQGLSTPRALGGLMLVAAAVLAGCGGGSDSPPAASPAPPAATPAPPAAAPAPPAATPTPVATTVPANFATGSALPNQGIVYYKDANANATLDAGERAVVYNPATQHYYELVTNLGAANAVTGLTWDAALAAGALGFSISGSGPSVFAWCRGDEIAAGVRQAVAGVFARHALPCDEWSGPIAPQGAHLVG